jgi:hypothetical protein
MPAKAGIQQAAEIPGFPTRSRVLKAAGMTKSGLIRAWLAVDAGLLGEPAPGLMLSP